jgi:hypothetical protein
MGERIMRGYREAVASSSRRGAALGAMIGALCFLGFASHASAAYEQLPGDEGIFAGVLGAPPPEFPEEVQLGGVGGMAVNRTGAGGVPAGTVYAAAQTSGPPWVAMYVPKGGTGKRLEFVKAWQVRPGNSAYERCGKLAIEKGEGVACEPHPEAQAREVDVDVDQATGNVFAIDGSIATAGKPMIAIYKADGSAEIASFGKRAPEGKKTAETPSEIHESPQPGGLAVGPGGTVYVFDRNVPDNFYHRLMAFKPKTPGVFSEYEYVVGGDIGAGFVGQGNSPTMPVSDAAGHVYVALVGGNTIEEYDPANPGAGPICEFEFAQGGINSITVDPIGEEVFYFSEKKVEGAKRVHRLAPCKEGKFTEVETIGVTPERDELFALAFDPLREVSPTRPPGVLYGGAPGPVPDVGKGEPGQSSLGYTFARTEESPPAVGVETFSAVTAGSVQLHAQINPKGFPTRYAFQYITQAAWEANLPGEEFNGALEVPLGGAVLGEGSKAIAAAATLTGLSPDTTYHYRAIATNCPAEEPAEACEAEGADQVFRTLASSSQGNRAFELVSPPEKNGGQALPADAGFGSCGHPECKPGIGMTRFPMVSSPDGDALAYEGTPFFPGEGAAVENQYFAPRNPQTGWASANLTPQLLVSKGGGGYKTFTPSLATALLQQFGEALTIEAPLEFSNFYLEQNATPFVLAALLTSPPPNRQPGNGPERMLINYAGASTDLSKVFFTANDALTLQTPVAPPAEGGLVGEENLYEWSAAGIRLVNVAPANAATFPDSEFGGQGIVPHAISADGSVAFWSDPTGQLYSRIDAERTVEIDDPGKFLSASADGSQVLLDDGCLYLLAEEECTDLTADEAEVHQGAFLGLSGQSEDLSHIYFVDSAVLTTALNERGQEAQATKPNLYAWVEGKTSFIATLAASDHANPANDTWAISPSSRAAEASPQGRFLTFLSRAQLTGYNNLGPCELNNPGNIVPCPEAFLFDSATGKLLCASCNPTEAPPLGYTVLRQLEGANSAMAQPRYLTDSGRLYFDSRDKLSVADSNGGDEDVYEFAPPGVAGCGREAGCPRLVSSGREDTESNFVTIDPSGENVFFTTRQQLVPADSDELIDLYDAREGGGIPAEAVPKPLPCQGEACQSPPPPAPEPQPNSQPQTEGNTKPKPPKCKKGQVRKNGKCVKRNQGKKKGTAKKQGRAHKQGGSK